MTVKLGDTDENAVALLMAFNGVWAQTPEGIDKRYHVGVGSDAKAFNNRVDAVGYATIIDGQQTVWDYEEGKPV